MTERSGHHVTEITGRDVVKSEDSFLRPIRRTMEETSAGLKLFSDFREDADERAAGRTGESRGNNDFAKEMR
jgi:hypothetical protein